MQLFNTKKPAADTAALDAAEEHKQSIGDQVMEALGVVKWSTVYSSV